MHICRLCIDLWPERCAYGAVCISTLLVYRYAKESLSGAELPEHTGASPHTPYKV